MFTVDVTLEITRGSKKTRQVKLRAEETTIGRQDGCDMRIPSAAVSRKHCRLKFHEGYLSVEDLGSTNGTFVNGTRVIGTRRVLPGELIEIGPISFLVKYELSEAAMQKLREEGPPPIEAEDLVDVEPVEDDEIVDVEPVDDKKQTLQFDLSQPEPPAKKTAAKKEPPRPKPAAEPSEEDISPGEVSDMFDGPLTIPVEQDLRDLLSGLDDSKDD